MSFDFFSSFLFDEGELLELLDELGDFGDFLDIFGDEVSVFLPGDFPAVGVLEEFLEVGVLGSLVGAFEAFEERFEDLDAEDDVARRES